MRNRRSWEQLRAIWPDSAQPVAYAIDAGAGIAVIACRDHPTITEWAQVLAALLADPGWKNSHDLIIDYGCGRSERKPFLVEAIRYANAHRDHMSGRLAIVVQEGPVSDGLTTAIAALPGNRRTVQVFGALEAASDWLGLART